MGSEPITLCTSFREMAYDMIKNRVILCLVCCGIGQNRFGNYVIKNRSRNFQISSNKIIVYFK